jgi:hypothetical protein
MILGITGFARTGKDTAAKALNGYVRRAFADALKRELQSFLISAYGINPMDCSPEQKEFIRPYLVTHGERRRAADPMHWIDMLKPDLEYVDPMDWHDYTTPGMHYKTKQLPNVVITDCRYANEAVWVEERGGRTILIVRPGFGPANDEEAGSIRELIASGLVSATIDNDGTVDQLYDKIRREVLP